MTLWVKIYASLITIKPLPTCRGGGIFFSPKNLAKMWEGVLLFIFSPKIFRRFAPVHNNVAPNFPALRAGMSPHFYSEPLVSSNIRLKIRALRTSIVDSLLLGRSFIVI